MEYIGKTIWDWASDNGVQDHEMNSWGWYRAHHSGLRIKGQQFSREYKTFFPYIMHNGGVFVFVSTSFGKCYSQILYQFEAAPHNQAIWSAEKNGIDLTQVNELGVMFDVSGNVF